MLFQAPEVLGDRLQPCRFALERFGDGRPPEDFQARLGELNRLVGDLIDRVRDLSLDLRPAMLDDFGLLPALRWLTIRPLVS